MKYIYRIYQIIIALPIIIILTILTAVTTSIGCTLGNGHFWGYYPPVIWSSWVLKVLFLPVKVTGRENLKHGESYVFVSNHQGAFDIFLIFGHLHRNFKWMMKRQLRSIPFVGYACEKSHQIFVDKRGPSKVKETYDKARHTLKEGMSVVVFPEGSRTPDGRMHRFKKGAYQIADDLSLPVVPMTIDGSYRVLSKNSKLIRPGKITLTIHEPVYPGADGHYDMEQLIDETYRSIASVLPQESGITNKS